ncbi:MAG: histidine phosphatase family protein [Candidatus Acidiferrales bacterium]
MSRLFLVRHGQASFLEADYDKLSPLGETQSRLLGEYWARRSMLFDRIATGPRARQKDTARFVDEAYRRAGAQLPETIVMPEFDEYDGETVLRLALPELLETSREVRESYDFFTSSSNPPDRSKHFQKFFEIVVSMWVRGEIHVPGVESWAEFSARVNRGISQFISRCGHGVNAAIFCSGGPIAVAVERALHLASRDTLQVMWMSRNASYTEFLFSGDRFTLSAFNAFPHLDDPSLLTYR